MAAAAAGASHAVDPGALRRALSAGGALLEPGEPGLAGASGEIAAG
jgi:hypothetical protein